MLIYMINDSIDCRLIELGEFERRKEIFCPSKTFTTIITMF